MLWRRLGASWGRLGASWGRGLGRPGAVLERFKGRLGRGCEPSSAVLGRLGTSLERLQHQTEVLRLRCHLVHDLKLLFTRMFVQFEHVNQPSGTTKIRVLSLETIIR